MSISDVLHHKGNQVIKAAPTDTVLAAVGLLAEHRIGAVIVEDARMHPVGVFSERDFVNATARHGAAALSMTGEDPASAGDRSGPPAGHRQHRRFGEAPAGREGAGGRRAARPHPDARLTII
jgi:CBS domain-containing protein